MQSVKGHDGRVNSYVVIEPTYQKSKRWLVSMVVLAVDERLKTGDPVETLDSPSTLTSRLNRNYTYIAATRLPRKTAPMVLLRLAIRLAVKFSREDDKQVDRPAIKRQNVHPNPSVGYQFRYPC